MGRPSVDLTKANLVASMLEDDELIEWAVEAGADEDEVRPLIEGRVFRDWIEEATDDMSEQGVESTPGAVIDGEVADDATMAVLTWLQTL